MDDFKQQMILDRANRELQLNYADKHRVITPDEIQRIFERNDLLGVNVDAKTKKGSKRGYLTGILYLAPAKLSGIEVCPGRSEGCTKACLFSAGRGRFYGVNRARVVKTIAYHFDKALFTAAIKKSIASLVTKANNKKMTPVVRLNGTSDLVWDETIFTDFPKVQFYDYTKLAGRFNTPRPSNYHLTFSMSETNQVKALDLVSKGVNVAVVFQRELPVTFEGYKVIDGDKTDLRFLDKGAGVIVGLKAKGQAKKDTSGFVINPLRKVA